MRKALLSSVVLVGAACPAVAEGIRGGRCMLATIGLAPGTVNSLTAAPGTISFTAASPESGAVSGSSAATLNWSVLSGSHFQTWTVSVQAAASSFTGCATVPVTAVSVACASAAVGGGAGTGSCGGAFALSTVAQQVAGGAEGDGNQAYSVQINYTLAESWRYVANASCTLTLTYTVNAL
ncbi:MAG: hypothetical protein ACKV2U_10605 [Bryobacteraceae bacterium]